MIELFQRTYLMKLFSALAAAALAITGLAAPAHAHHVDYRHYFDDDRTERLSRNLMAHGVELYTDIQMCRDNPRMMGVAIKGEDASFHLVVCVDNHQGNHNEMADTFRHEVVHLAQYCKAERAGTGHSILPLWPENAKDSYEIAQMLHMPFDAYPEEKWLVEAEARTMAYLLDEDEIGYQFANQCAHRRVG